MRICLEPSSATHPERSAVNPHDLMEVARALAEPGTAGRVSAGADHAAVSSGSPPSPRRSLHCRRAGGARCGSRGDVAEVGKGAWEDDQVIQASGPKTARLIAPATRRNATSAWALRERGEPKTCHFSFSEGVRAAGSCPTPRCPSSCANSDWTRCPTASGPASATGPSRPRTPSRRDGSGARPHHPERRGTPTPVATCSRGGGC